MKINKKVLTILMMDEGIDNKQLSAKSGVSITRISNIKNGQNTTYETVCKIADALNVDVMTLINGEVAIKREYRREREILSDYEDMPYQFDNMTGSMNL